MVTADTEPGYTEQKTIPRLPKVVKVQVKDSRNPFRQTAVVQVVDYYANLESEAQLCKCGYQMPCAKTVPFGFCKVYPTK